jgi:hypothetical protein
MLKHLRIQNAYKNNNNNIIIIIILLWMHEHIVWKYKKTMEDLLYAMG